MADPSLLLTAINRLAMAGELAGFSVEHMIALLNGGTTVETLLDLIDQQLAAQDREGPLYAARSSPWVM
jgi:hypothetical protein